MYSNAEDIQFLQQNTGLLDGISKSLSKRVLVKFIIMAAYIFRF